MTKLNILPGTLDLIVLKVLSIEPLHGYAVSQRVQAASNGRLLLEEGSLYPALYRMERKGWIESEWQKTDNGRRARVYRLSDEGGRQLAQEEANWLGVSAVMGSILDLK
ncbi:MAG: PadR family transcriptional regulator [Acidobacteria bacterium]|nr:PadR family transcriptional regulator [Acidobacteriota bacterium]